MSALISFYHIYIPSAVMDAKLLFLLMLMGLGPLLFVDAQITYNSLYRQSSPRDAASNQWMPMYAGDNDVAHWGATRLFSRTLPVHPNRCTLPVNPNSEASLVALGFPCFETVNRISGGSLIRKRTHLHDVDDQKSRSGMGLIAADHRNLLPRSYSRTVREARDTILDLPQRSKLFRRVHPFLSTNASTSSHPQQPSQPPYHCNAKFGTDILLADCDRAFLEIQSIAAQGATNDRSAMLNFFSRSHVAAEPKSRLPRGAGWGTCSLGVDIAFSSSPDMA
jgi:hypothetical protein